MKHIFSYNKFNDEALDGIVESGYALTQAFLEGKGNTHEYSEANKQFNESLMKFCAEGNVMNYNGLEDIKNPMVHKNSSFLEKFDVVLAQILTPVIPTVVASGYDQLYDVTQVGFGDSAAFQVESNELFIVNDLAEGIRNGAQQTASNTEYTIQAQRQTISLYCDWYHVAAGKQNWGSLLAKVGASFAAYVMGRVAKVMSDVITTAGEHGIAGYIANGMTDANWLTTARNVSLANGGAQVYALGTNIALADVLPADAQSFRYGEAGSIVRDGYLPEYKKIPLIELGNCLVPNTINGTPEVVLDDDIIYMLPLGFNKPVHVVMEGNSVSVQRDPMYAADHTYGFTVDMRLGVGIVIRSKIGCIQLQ